MIFSQPAKYLPMTRGVYEVTPGLRPLGTDFGNGELDNRVFQIDTDFPRFRESKLACRQDRFEKYFQTARLSKNSEHILVDWMIKQLIAEYPSIFTLEHRGSNRGLICHHTKDVLLFDTENKLVDSDRYLSAFDALANQVAEDVCLTQRDESGDWLAGAHVCSPGHWSAGEKIGKPFTAIHQPVPGIEPITRRSDQFVDMMINRGPFVRFAWGFGTDDRLNHHPDAPAGIDPATWRGRAFDTANPEFFLRIERQVMWGLPTVNAAVFTIRVSHLPGNQIRANPAQRRQLASALKSMSPESRRYKGLDGSLDQVIGWLNQAE